MNSLDRAKAFLKGRGAKLALAVIPLATIAVSTAQAVRQVGPVFGPPASGSGVSYSCSGCSFNPNFAITTLPLFNGAQGIRVSGPASFTANSPGDYNLYLQFSGVVGGGSFGSATMPVDYLFSVDPGNGTFTHWNLEFGVSETPSTYLSFTTSGAGSGSQPVDISGTGTITGLLAGQPYAWNINLTLDWTANATGATLNLDLPLDIGSVPEPASILLVGPGIGLLMLVRRRRKA